MGIFESDPNLSYSLTLITDQLWASQTRVILSIPTCPVTPVAHVSGSKRSGRMNKPEYLPKLNKCPRTEGQRTWQQYHEVPEQTDAIKSLVWNSLPIEIKLKTLSPVNHLWISYLSNEYVCGHWEIINCWLCYVKNNLSLPDWQTFKRMLQGGGEIDVLISFGERIILVMHSWKTTC